MPTVGIGIFKVRSQMISGIVFWMSMYEGLGGRERQKLDF